MDDSTHVVYRGKHFKLPGKMPPEEALLRVKNLTGSLPKIGRSDTHAVGFEDTSGDAAQILEQYHEPNRPQDVLPGLAEFALLYGLPGAAGPIGKGVQALRGLSAAQKALTVGKAATKAAAYGAAGAAADKGLREMGVPAGFSEVAVAAAGLGTRPGRAGIKAVVEALSSKGAARGAAKVAEKESAALLAQEADVIAAKVLEWKTKNKFSNAQITSALWSQYRISPKDGKRVIAMVLESDAPEAAAKTAKRDIQTRIAQAYAAESAPAATAGTYGQNIRTGHGPLASMAANMQRFEVPANASAEAKAAASVVKNVAQKIARGTAGPEDVKAAQEAMVVMARERSGVQASRVEVGAAKVGRDVGMSKEDVRQVAGPVLNEARGEASPVLPKQALYSIIDKMKGMPMSEREAYVARATSGKAQWQVENIRRTLEHLGLLLPAGAGAAYLADEESR